MMFGCDISVIVDLGSQFGRAATSAQARVQMVSDSSMVVLLVLMMVPTFKLEAVPP
jgi:hypothetical protein